MENEDLRLGLAIESLYRKIRRAGADSPMSPTEAAVLWRLSTHGPGRITEMADGQHVSQPAMTQLVNRLEAAGRVRRIPDPSDARVVRVSITETGAEAVERRLRERIALIRGLIEQLPAGERALLRAAAPAIEHLAQ